MTSRIEKVPRDIPSEKVENSTTVFFLISTTRVYACPKQWTELKVRNGGVPCWHATSVKNASSTSLVIR